MFNFSISVIPLIVLSLVNFILSWVWYSPLLFAKPWMKALGIDPKHEMTEEDKKRMPFLFISGIVSSFVLVFILMVLINTLQISNFFYGLLFGLLVWLGFALTHSLNTLWEGRKVKVLIINNGLFCLSYVLYSGILAVWK